VIEDLEAEIAGLEAFSLHALRDKWRERFGAPPKFRSTEMLRLLLAWRIQAVALGGLDRETREALARTGRVVAEGQDLGIGATLRRIWNGEESLFSWEKLSGPPITRSETGLYKPGLFFT
jgi:hypothetical protein